MDPTAVTIKNMTTMKFNSKFFLIAGLALTLVGCKDDFDPSIPVEKGSEVVFKAVSDEATRTAYGELGETSRPVYWVNGDLVTVGSPQCLAGRNIAQYSVAATGTAQNYATSLDKTGEYGVQWGSADASNAKFFAVYPATVGNNNMTFDSNGNATATMQIAANQEIPVQAVTTSGKTSYSPNLAQWQTKDNVMYAQPVTGQQQVTTANGVTTANLKFKPYSTVLHFTLAGWKWDTTSGETGADKDNMVIYSVTLTASGTTSLAGTFDLQLKADGTTPGVGDVTDGSTSVTSQFVTRSSDGTSQVNGIEMLPNSPLEFDMFVCPSNISIDDKWTISVRTSAGTYSRELNDILLSTDKLELTPGQIHKIPKLPALSTATSWDYDPTEWMADLSDNIYFTELTFPGSWYSANNTQDTGKDTGYQENNSMQEQWNAGIRAFYFETRVGYTSRVTPDDFGTLNVLVNAQGVIDNAANSRNNDAVLVMSGTGGNSDGGFDLNTYYSAQAAETYIKKVASIVKNGKPSECAVLTLAYSDGGDAGVSGFWRAVWLQKIKNVIDKLLADKNDTAFKDVYYQDPITPQTTLKQVRGKLILKINIDTPSEIDGATTTYKRLTSVGGTGTHTDTVDPNIFSSLKALYSFTSYDWTTSQEKSLVADLTSSAKPTIPSGSLTTPITNTGFFCNYTVANRTYGSGAKPTIADRQSSINTIFAESGSNRNKENHNVLFMIGAGGSYFANNSSKNGDPASIANDLNPFLSGLISEKIKNGTASPLGFVYFNQIGTTVGKNLLDKIIRLNKRYDPVEEDTPQQPIEAVTAKEGFGSGFKVSANGYKVF